MVNNAKVIKPDIKASNGVIHVIDSVILPPAAAKAVTVLGSAASAAGKVGETVKKAESTTQKSTPGFESIFAVAGLFSVGFIACRRWD